MTCTINGIPFLVLAGSNVCERSSLSYLSTLWILCSEATNGSKVKN